MGRPSSTPADLGGISSDPFASGGRNASLWQSAERGQDEHDSGDPREKFCCGVRHEIRIPLGWPFSHHYQREL